MPYERIGSRFYPFGKITVLEYASAVPCIFWYSVIKAVTGEFGGKFEISHTVTGFRAGNPVIQSLPLVRNNFSPDTIHKGAPKTVENSYIF